MTYKVIDVIDLKELLPNNSNTPILLLGSDNNLYFTKFARKQTEHNLLAFEFLGNRLANYFNINTPEVCIVRYKPKPYEPLNHYYSFYAQLPDNTLSYGFGSKRVSSSIDINSKEVENLIQRRNFIQLDTPYHLLLIVLFDLHLNNIDRTALNFNLMVQTNTGSQLTKKVYAIDHMGIFGGPAAGLRFNEKATPELAATIFNSELFRFFCKSIDYTEAERVINGYFNLCNDYLGVIIKEPLTKISSFINFDGSLVLKATEYLTCNARNNRIKELVLAELALLIQTVRNK